MKDKTPQQLLAIIEKLEVKLWEAEETIDAIRTGQVDALVVDAGDGHQLYTLKTADHSYRAFIERMTEGALTLNRNGTILFANSTFAKMVSQELYGVIGMDIAHFVHEESKEQFRQVFGKAWTEDAKTELYLHAANGPLPILLSFTMLELPEGPALSALVTDLSAQKNTQKQLETNNSELLKLNSDLEISNNDLLQFASVASHDLQEPLRKIQMFSNFLKTKASLLSEGEREQYIEKIRFSADRMRTLIIDVLNYSKLSAKDRVFEPVDISIIVNEVIIDFELLIGDKGANINVGKLPCVMGTRGQLRQIFQNIISNSLKFSKAGVPPVIDISSRNVQAKAFDSAPQTDGAYTIVTIKDNGIGFDDKYQSNIFALFERLNSKDAYEGTGIGMAIAKKIMDKHDGLIMAAGTVNEGAEFSLLFHSINC